MKDPRDFDFDPQDRLLELLLGDTDGAAEAGVGFPDDSGDPSEGAEAQDLEDLRGLVDGLRGLSCEPTGRVALGVRAAVERRVRLRGHGEETPVWPLVRQGLQVAAVAAAIVGAALLGESVYHRWQLRRGSADGASEQLAHWAPSVQEAQRSDVARSFIDPVRPIASTDVAPRPRYLVQGEKERATYPYRLFRMKPAVVEQFGPARGQLEDVAPQDVWMVATNAVDTMRIEFENRFHPTLRRQAIRAAGGSRFLAARIEALAAEISTMLDDRFAEGDLAVQEVSLGLRALLAGGSTRRIGEHAEQVRRCSDWLLARLPGLGGGELATALSGLVEVAVVSGPLVCRQVGEHASRLAESVIYSKSGHRPQMLNWHAGGSQLADAGMVLRLAPAFGTVNKEALLARTYLATHLRERLASSTEERPDLLAALLYGYGDLIDRDGVDRRLSIWRAGDLVPEYYGALHHVAWSRFPVRFGWTDFQRQLRRVSVIDTPDSVADAGSLLLALAASYAAPGSQELQALTMR